LWSGLGAWLFAPLTPWLANRLSYVQGKTEVIAPAQWRPGGILSPDGRYMVAGWTKDSTREQLVWDLMTDERYPLTLDFSSLCWLNPGQFVVRDSSTETYYVVVARNPSVMQAILVPEQQYIEPGALERIQARWQAAEQVYAMKPFGIAGYTVVTVEQGQPYVYRGFGNAPDSEVATLLESVSHIRLRERCNHPAEGVPVYSPDGQFYTQLSTGENAHVLIYSRDGDLVAEAAKTGWDPRLMGWAHDSSGVYFQMLISGGGASMLVPYQPIFKLSPSTPEEERSRLIWSVVTWAVGVAVVAVLIIWLWRRRKRIVV
jgi:hypothetical protein